ncbi:hypothetical protein AQUCO_01000504v1 [Aquilegia coerulea]|uniref:Cyclin-like domain-containing protein n=1 Tax=Aquilegia coerulea TaxID=218851 RepID=A0A2G5EAB2_AQUCA|nr:hypothetical protein AQUCO_01000504v1 [Aquilegia coerulea]
MAGLLPGDSAHLGIVEGGPNGFSQDKPEEGGRWYLSRKEIEENSPSRRDGIDLKKETYLRKSYCTFLQDLGMRLKVPQVTIATAIIFCHRFFLRQSHMKNDRRTIATVCMFLAGKVEETPRPLKDVILVSYEIIHKKDPAAVQKIKQKEVYEQQKELILLGERVVLATLGFDFNVNHPYKPLVEAIKKFKVAQNALAQVAWNFVNDGLRTSLCLQFKPHHIAAGAIFLAAKFLKVKLPSDGEKVWWQEFDVTPRQLEEVSNQMLELYEQNRLPASQGSEFEGGALGGASVRATTKAPVANEESIANGYAQGGGMSTVKPGSSSTSANRLSSDQLHSDYQGGSHKSAQNRSNDYGSTEIRSLNSEPKPDGDSECRLPEQDLLPYNREDEGETSNRSRFGSERPLDEDEEKGAGKFEAAEAGEWKTEGASYKASNPLSQSPQDAIKKIDKDKVKAALEKRRKSRPDVARKMDVMDDDDLIERELEDGIELAADYEKTKQERRQSWSKLSNRAAAEIPNHGDDKNDVRGEGKYSGSMGKSREPDIENVEEGEMPLSDDAGPGSRSPKSSNLKRKVVSPDKHQLEGLQRHDYTPGSQNHHDVEGGSKMGRNGYTERDSKRHRLENHV